MEIAEKNINAKKPYMFRISLVAALLGLLTPIPAIVFYILLTWNTKDDGWLAVFVIVIALGFWILMLFISGICLIAGFYMKEKGSAKTFAIISFIISALPPLVMVGFIVIAGAFDSYGK